MTIVHGKALFSILSLPYTEHLSLHLKINIGHTEVVEHYNCDWMRKLNILHNSIQGTKTFTLYLNRSLSEVFVFPAIFLPKSNQRADYAFDK